MDSGSARRNNMGWTSHLAHYGGTLVVLFWFLLVDFSHVASADQTNSCSEVRYLYEQASGTIRSENFPFPYPSNQICSWKIIARQNERIVLSFPTFQVDGGPLCQKDFVEIYDVDQATGGTKFVGKYCSNILPQAHFITEGSEVLVVLHSGYGEETAQGGRVVELAYSKLACGGNLTALQGSFNSPNFPKAYPSDKLCSWLIVVPEDSVVLLEFKKFDIEPKSACLMDYVEVLDGDDDNSLQLGRYCSSDPPPSSIRSTSNKLRVTFKTYASTVHSGFLAEYKALPHCGGLLKEDSGSFTSPGYGLANHELAEERWCTWVIDVQKGSVVSLSFHELDIPSGGNGTFCLNNYVSVYDGVHTKALELGRFCNRDSPHNNFVRTSSHIMRIHYRTDRTFTGKGFFASYISVDPHNLFDKCTRLENHPGLLFPCENGMSFIDCEYRCDGTSDCSDGSDELYCSCGDSCEKDTTKSSAEPYVITILATMVTAVLLCITVFVIERIWRKRRRRTRRSRRRAHHLARVASSYISTLNTMSPPPPYSPDADDALSVSSTLASPPSYAMDGPPEVEEATVHDQENCNDASNADTRTQTYCSSSEDIAADQNFIPIYESTVSFPEAQDDEDSVSISSNDNHPLIRPARTRRNSCVV